MKSGKHFRKAANTLCLPFIWTNKALKSLSGPKIEIFIWFNNSLESLSGPKKKHCNLYLAQKTLKF